MIRGFLFDLDGTLVDTHKANFEAYKKALAPFGIDITWEEFKPSIGHQAKTFLPKLAPGLSREQYDEIRATKAEYYKELVHMTEANEPLIEFMRAMAMHYPVALVTTAQAANADSVLKHHGLDKVLAVRVTAADVEIAKPDPAGYVLALQKLGLKADEVIAFEDSEVGKQAAEAAGIPVVMVKDFAI